MLSSGQQEGDCQNALCNRCNLRGGVAGGEERGRRRRGSSGPNRHTPHTYSVPNRQSPFQHAKPDVALWFMRGAGAAQHRGRVLLGSGWDVYIATGVPCVSNYRSSLPHGEAFILTVLSGRRQPCWPCLFISLAYWLKVIPVLPSLINSSLYIHIWLMSNRGNLFLLT